MNSRFMRTFYSNVITSVCPDKIQYSAKLILFNVLNVVMSMFVWRLFGVVLFVLFFHIFYRFSFLQIFIQVFCGVLISFLIDAFWGGKEFYLLRGAQYSNYEIAKNIIKEQRDE